MTAEKDAHMAKFITEGLRTNVIRPSKARYYSQVHLVAKPQADATTAKHNVHIDNTSKLTSPSASSISNKSIPREWRTTIDYRHYNTCITKQHWPIPNIKSIIDRIDKAKPKYFAKLDMTKGYWQAPLEESSRIFTAFICFMGIFEWNRAPMGTQPAGGYFQQIIAFVVLVGLTFIIDILVHAKTLDKCLTDSVNIILH